MSLSPMTPRWAPARQVALDGAVNVRDIGGYRSTCGLEVLRGRLFRGDALSQLSGPDLGRLGRLGLCTVIDFRTPGEILLSGPDRLPAGVEYASLPVTGGDLGGVYELITSGDHGRQRRELGDGRAAWFMVEMNRGFVADARQREAFGIALRLCTPGRLPLLYHCSSGKDRAGWMTAIVLTALGVPREVVVRDYLLSNDFHRTEYVKLRYDLVKAGIVADPELLRPIMEQSATYLGAAFEEADRRYGSFGAFLTCGLEVSDRMLSELRRGLLGERVPPAPVRLGAGPGLALAGARADTAQLQPGEQRVDHRQPDQDAHVAQPGTRRVIPQGIGEVAADRRVDHVEVHGGGHRAETPPGRRQPGQLLQPGQAVQREQGTAQDDLEQGQHDQHGHGLFRGVDHRGNEQAEAHRGQAD
jgi:protein-tyrosine phosphatase